MFLVSLVSQSGAVTVARPSALEALALAYKLQDEGEVAITTPGGHTLAVHEFTAIFHLA